jgi:hypothetical protein
MQIRRCSFTRYGFVFLLFSTSAFGQIFEVKNREGALVATVSEVKMFRYSDAFEQEIPEFRGVLKNVSGENLLNVAAIGIVHRKDGAVVRFKVSGFTENTLL